MTSVNTSSSSYAIDLQRNGRHQVSSLEDDQALERLKKDKNQNNQVAIAVLQRAGDNSAVIANATRDGGNTGGATTGSAASLVSSSLTSRGMSLSQTGISSVDGFGAESPNASAALDFSGPPQLPDISTRAGTLSNPVSTAPSTPTSTAATISHAAGNIVANGQTSLTRAVSSATSSGQAGQVPLQGSDLMARLSDYQSRNADGDGGLMWYALSTMAKGAGQDEKDAADIKNAMQKGKVEEKKNEIKATEEQIQKEREAAAMNLMISIVAAVVQIACAGGGTATQAIGSAVSQVIKSLGEYINKVAGPQAEADNKKVEIMRHQMMQEIYEQGIENAKSNYDEARELMKLAIKILSEHAERQTQISTTITRT